ncbi:hypothetical protein QVD17_20938 [Tagetes erecta]|uniref:DNL-type domain-containing protein n=1 Tax=Tagetes erecta TaxID=13708 RepID=A0AAD8NYI9_TARER|nr:hypothetical protein QVD17_20938 [Tagetes erecta]
MIRKRFLNISLISFWGATIDLKLPRRSLLVQFTCNACGVRSQKLINRLAYEKGMVFVQCTGCSQYHKLVDNLNLVVEYDFRDETNTHREVIEDDVELEHSMFSKRPALIPFRVLLQVLLADLKRLLLLGLYFANENELHSALLFLTSSPNIEVIVVEMRHNPMDHVSQTAMNFFDPQDCSHIILDK